MSDNIREHKTVTKDGYEITFHPAFASRCSVTNHDVRAGEKELYKQKEKHVFKKGEKHPKKHTIKLKGGKHNRDFELVVSDPKHHVARITIEFYSDGHEPGWGLDRMSAPIETLAFDNNSGTCPPNCGDNDSPPSS